MGKGQNEGGFSEDQILVHLDLVFGEAALKGFHILSKMGKGQNEGGFSEDQIQMYKDCFKLRTSTRMESLTRTTSVAPSTTSVSSCPSLSLMVFLAYDNAGKMDSKTFEHALKTWGDKMTKAEIDDVFGEFDIDEDYMLKTKDVVGLFVQVKE